MKKLAEKLTDKERDIFFERFYQDSVWEDGDDREGDFPWGSPWLISEKNVIKDEEKPMLEGENIEEMADYYMEEVRHLIQAEIEEEKSSE